MNPAGPRSGSSRTPSRTVFVGNIPYDFTEEQLLDIFKEVGPVKSLRLMFDRETGKPRGYGFCEFFDAETAGSAVRNLSNYDVGGRPLRVDFADVEMTRPSGQDGVAPPPHQQQQQQQPPPPPAQPGMMPPPPSTSSNAQMQPSGPGVMGQRGLPPPSAASAASNTRDYRSHDERLRPGAMPDNSMGGHPSGSTPSTAPNVPSTELIAKALANLNQAQLLEVVYQLKALATTHPHHVRTLLQQNPQLSYAVLDCLVKLGLIDTMAIQRAQGGQQPAQQPAQQPQPGHPTQTPSAAFDLANSLGMSMGVPPSGGAVLPGQQLPPPPPPPNAPAIGGNVDALQQQTALLQLLSLTPQQIDNLSPDQRAIILQLRSQLGAGAV